MPDLFCDWCGRQGFVRRYSSSDGSGSQLDGPSLCDRCWPFSLSTPARAEEVLVHFYGREQADREFYKALTRRFRARFDDGMSSGNLGRSG
jgi:hypothetical protein